MGEWIGVDLDGTLAEYHGGLHAIGKPIELMMVRVRDWLSKGKDVRIFTARAREPKQVELIKKWCVSNGLPELPITNVKDYDMVELWDNIAVHVKTNTGELD